MELIDKINIIYEQIGERILGQLSDSAKINIERQVNRRIGTFSIVLEIIVTEKVHDDDYGLVFATNVQINSHFSHKNKRVDYDGGLFIISDLSTGNGEVIDSTEEFTLLPSNKESVDYAVKKIELFVQTIAPSVCNIITERYG